ncbi:MAG: hypothetical protein ACJ72V_11350 [Nitrososphaeraceae archaeon]
MHQSNSNSTEAQNQLLLQVARKNNNINNLGKKSKDYNNSRSYSVFYLSINNSYKNILRTGANAEEYYHVELICNEDNGIEYGIQAYGEEAKELYKEINGFTVVAAATPPRHVHKEVDNSLENYNKLQEEEQEKLKLVMKAIDCITDYYFDNGCVLIFRKLRNVCISKRKVVFNRHE